MNHSRTAAGAETAQVSTCAPTKASQVGTTTRPHKPSSQQQQTAIPTANDAARSGTTSNESPRNTKDEMQAIVYRNVSPAGLQRDPSFAGQLRAVPEVVPGTGARTPVNGSSKLGSSKPQRNGTQRNDSRQDHVHRDKAANSRTRQKRERTSEGGKRKGMRSEERGLSNPLTRATRPGSRR